MTSFLGVEMTSFLGGEMTSNSDRYGRQKVSALSIAERRLVGLVMAGYTNREIAEALDMVEQTVKNMLSGVYRKCDVRNRTELVKLAFQAGLIPLAQSHPRAE